MDSRHLKALISRRTHIALDSSSMVRQSMADTMGTKYMRNRNLEWKEFTPESIPTDIPTAMSEEISNLINNFSTDFHQHSPQYAGTQVVFSFYASDPSIRPEHLQAIVNSDNPKKDSFLSLVDWMDHYGVRMWLSSRGKAIYSRDNKKDLGSSDNMSLKWLETFGYVWGLKKQGDYRHVRQSNFVGDEIAAKYHKDAELQEEWKEQDARLVQVITDQKNGAWGVYFTDGTSNFPIIGDNYYAKARGNENSTDIVDKQIFKGSKGQHRKFFMCKDQSGQDRLILPMESTFALFNGEDDPNPIFIHKNQIKAAENEGIPLYRLIVREDGTMWFVEKSGYGTATGKKYRPSNKKRANGTIFPLTREQVEAMSPHNGQWYKLTNPDTMVYSWDSLPENTAEQKSVKQEKMNDWKEKTQLMDELYDFLASQKGMEPPHVALQAFKYAIIGPRFVEAENTDQNETIGRMKSPQHHIQDIQNTGGELFAASRKDWVVVANEFNKARAEARGESGMSASQSMDGMGPVSGFSTVESAVQKAFKTWGINCPPPDQNRLKTAQAAFEAAHASTRAQQQQPNLPDAIPQINNNVADEFGHAPVQPLPLSPEQNHPMPTRNIVNQPMENEEAQGVLANNTSSLNKSAESVIRQLKRLR